MIEFFLVISMIMTLGYGCGVIGFRLLEKYYGKKDD
jgi:hypothetical protein